MESRGYRNCNPGNIRITKDKWQGLRAEQTDKEFFQFVSMPYGYRALLRTLQNYKRKWGCDTIADMINRWAPSCENHTSEYIKAVTKDLQVPSSYSVDINDAGVMCLLAGAISRVENGCEPNMEEIRKGWELLKQ